MALFWNVLSLSLLGLATANNLALCKLTLIPKQAIGLVTGVQQVATSLAGGVSASLSGWLLHVSGNYDLPMMVIFVFLLIGATNTVILLRPKWAPKVTVKHDLMRALHARSSTNSSKHIQVAEDTTWQKSYSGWRCHTAACWARRRKTG
jgi:ACS family D-galactonate transporter-like MFS transporter